MSEQRLTCADCGREFTFSAGEQDYYRERGYTPPKRCKDCREAKKAQRGEGGKDEGRGNR